MFDGTCVYAVWLRDTIRYFREKSQLIGSIVRPMLWLFILGTGLRGSLPATQLQGYSYTQFIFPGIIAMTVVFTSIQSAITIVWDREFGFLKEMLVAPVPRTSIVIGKCLAGTTLSLIQAAIVMLFSPLVHVTIPLLRVPLLLLVIALLSFVLSGIGVVIAARMTSFQGFGTIMNFVIMPMWFLSGAMFPPVGLPTWLMALVRVNPLTYGVDLIRRLVLSVGYFGSLLDLGLLLAFGLLTVALAAFFFNRGEY